MDDLKFRVYAMIGYLLMLRMLVHMILQMNVHW